MSSGRLLLPFLFLLLLPVSAPAGDSVVKALVARCDLIDDEVVGKAVGSDARLAALRCMAGQIGPVTYVHHELRKMNNGKLSTDFGTTMSEARILKMGGLKVPPPTGRYDSVTPAGFETQVNAWITRARSGDAEASAELGATTFLNALPKKYRLSEPRLFRSFDLASIAGNVEAKFMKGVCLYYGIGCTRDKAAAFAALQDWKAASGTKKAVRGGWIARRFAEMKEKAAQ